MTYALYALAGIVTVIGYIAIGTVVAIVFDKTIGYKPSFRNRNKKYIESIILFWPVTVIGILFGLVILAMVWPIYTAIAFATKIVNRYTK